MIILFIIKITRKEYRKVRNKKFQILVASGVRRGGAPEIGKILVEIWCYLPEVYTFGAESEIQEIIVKIVKKKSIFHIDFDQKI